MCVPYKDTCKIRRRKAIVLALRRSCRGSQSRVRVAHPPADYSVESIMFIHHCHCQICSLFSAASPITFAPFFTASCHLQSRNAECTSPSMQPLPCTLHCIALRQIAHFFLSYAHPVRPKRGRGRRFSCHCLPLSRWKPAFILK